MSRLMSILPEKALKRFIPLWTGLQNKLSKKSSAANTIRTIMTSMFIVLLNLGTGIICARFLGPVGRGEQSAIMLWPSLLGQLFTLGLQTSVIYNMKKNPQESGNFIFTACLIHLGTSVFITAAGIWFVPVWLSSYSHETVVLAQILMFFAPSVLFTNYLNAVMQGREDFKGFNRRRYLPVVATLIMLLGLALTGHLTPFTSALSYFLPNVPVGIYTVYQLFRMYKTSLKGIVSSVKRLITYGLSSYLIDIVATLTLFMDQVVMVRLMTPTDLGLYLVALSLARMVGIFQNAIAIVLLPKAAGMSRDETISLTMKVFRIASTGTCIIALVLMVISPTALILLYGEKYREATGIIWILLLETALSGAVWVLAQTFMALGKPGKVSLLQAIGLSISIPLLIFLVPRFGLTGAACALLTATFVRFCFIMFQFPLSLKVPMPRPVPTQGDLLWFKQKITQRLKSNAT